MYLCGPGARADERTGFWVHGRTGGRILEGAVHVSTTLLFTLFSRYLPEALWVDPGGREIWHSVHASTTHTVSVVLYGNASTALTCRWPSAFLYGIRLAYGQLDFVG
jgi:hypothetical protein